MERGSDRIALITGRGGQNIPSSQPLVEDCACDRLSSQPNNQIQNTHDQIKATSDDDSEEILETDRKCEIQPLPAASPPPCQQKPDLFSSKRLNSCILESERTRGCCAFILAVLVVLSYVSYPLFGSHVVKSGSVVASRPLYILLLADVTIVFARLLSMPRNFEETAEERKVTREENQNWVEAVKVLERGLVAYQTVRAIFIDCSIYMVVVICGLSQL
ncbi:hypothetical protein SAY86_026062 [Trapa natans]|uniref:Uncharacterized protein n=1 Tax=Trapa natans TaxID=22666 RepID=A0AAN7QE75_TRANT|nr:hypothetical protein SAY86_026062 [Trapa natans]